MSEFALVNLTDNIVVQRQFIAEAKLPDVRAGFKWLPVVTDSEPTIDLNKSKIVGQYVIEATQVRHTFTEELLSEAQRKDNVNSLYLAKINAVLPIEDFSRTLARALQLLFKKVEHLEDSNNPALTVAEQTEVAQIKLVGDWQYAMLVYAKTLQAQIEGGAEPDISLGWPVLGS